MNISEHIARAWAEHRRTVQVRAVRKLLALVGEPQHGGDLHARALELLMARRQKLREGFRR